MRNFFHIQTSPSQVWTITHSLGIYPLSEVFVHYEGEIQKILPLSVVHPDLNTTEISFSSAMTGQVRLIG